MTTNPGNIDPLEISRFNNQAEHWWNPDGELKALHDINKLRLAYVVDRVTLTGNCVVDVGCGGGIFSEALAAEGAHVTGIDAAERQILVARSHLKHTGYTIDYIRTTAENFADTKPSGYDVVTCMELLEHVPNPSSVVRACAKLAKRGAPGFFFDPESHLGVMASGYCGG